VVRCFSFFVRARPQSSPCQFAHTFFLLSGPPPSAVAFVVSTHAAHGFLPVPYVLVVRSVASPCSPASVFFFFFRVMLFFAVRFMGFKALGWLFPNRLLWFFITTGRRFCPLCVPNFVSGLGWRAVFFFYLGHVAFPPQPEYLFPGCSWFFPWTTCSMCSFNRPPPTFTPFLMWDFSGCSFPICLQPFRGFPPLGKFPSRWPFFFPFWSALPSLLLLEVLCGPPAPQPGQLFLPVQCHGFDLL